MKKTLFQFALFYVLFSIFIGIGMIAEGQTALPALVSSSGNYYQNMFDSTSISWSIGEVIIETLEANNSILTQGFHQSMYIIDAINDIPVTGLSINVYPNPSTDLINVSWEFKTEMNFTIELYDLTGEKLLQREIWGNKFNEQINMSEFPEATYILILNTKEFIKSFKIIKK